MELESRLIPILREGVEVVKMLFFQKVRDNLAVKYPKQDRDFQRLMPGAVVNELFGTPNREEPFRSFVNDHRELIERELSDIAKDFADFQIALTDALRIQSLCDHQEGLEALPILKQAEKAGFLLMDRDLPLPHSFLGLVRRLGAAAGLIIPPVPAPPGSTPTQ